MKAVLVAWMEGSEKRVGRAEDLALGGLCICTAKPATVGKFLKLLFNAPEGEVRALAVVRYVSPRGMGLAITAMDPERRAQLSRWLQQLAKEA